MSTELSFPPDLEAPRRRVRVPSDTVVRPIGAAMDESRRGDRVAGGSEMRPARWARFADGADEAHPGRMAPRTIGACQRDSPARRATGDRPL